MSQLNKNQESADNPNRRHSLYLVNIIFMCCLTIVSLVDYIAKNRKIISDYK